MQDCLAEAGWEVEVFPDGSISPVDAIPEDQAGAYQQASAACNEPLTADEPTIDEVTPDQWTAIYEQELATAECLRGEGIDVPAAPSEAEFIERYMTTDPWTSYGFVGTVNEAEWNHLNATCPQPYL